MRFLLFALPLCAYAAEPAMLRGLIAEALANNPEVRAAQKKYEAARLRPSREGSLPDPVISLAYASNGSPLPGGQLGSNPTSNIGVSVSQQVPYPGKRQLRSEISQKEAEAEFWQYEAVQLAVRSRVSQAYHRLHHAYASLAVLAQSKELLTQMLRVSEARYTAGRTPQQDIFRAQMQISMLETRIVRMRQDRQTAVAELNSLLNRKPGEDLAEPVEEDLKPLAMTVDELLEKAAATSPELAMRLKTVARDELSVNLAKKELHPDYTISAGYFNQGTMAPMYQVRVDIPLRLHAEKNQRPAITEQVNLLAVARREFEAGEQQLQFRVREAFLAAETAWRLKKLFEDTILPQSQLTVESSLTAYQTGASDFVTVLNNLSTQQDVQEQLHEQEMNFQVALARLEEMTGVEIQ